MLGLLLLSSAFVVFCFVVVCGWRVGFGPWEWASLIVTCLAMAVTSLVCFRLARIEIGQVADLVPPDTSTIGPWLTAMYIALGVAVAGALSLFLACLRKTLRNRRSLFPFAYKREARANTGVEADRDA